MTCMQLVRGGRNRKACSCKMLEPWNIAVHTRGREVWCDAPAEVYTRLRC
jgi:hypothetical protein